VSSAEHELGTCWWRVSRGQCSWSADVLAETVAAAAAAAVVAAAVSDVQSEPASADCRPVH